MFTGLIEEIGKIKAIEPSSRAIRLNIVAHKIMHDVKLGDSISTNGVCLTVTSFNHLGFTSDVMPETMEKTNLGKLKIGSEVNLERAVRIGDRLGGHMVSGHIDGVGEITGKEKDDNAIWIHIAASEDILKYVVKKASIAIDGISLTVADVNQNGFKVSIIPLTQKDTTLTSKMKGETVNLECDMTAKYIEKFLHFREKQHAKETRISMDLLKENGFA